MSFKTLKNTKKETNLPAYNPFEGRNSEEVWVEIRKQKGSKISREEAIRAMEALTKKEK